MEKQGWRTCWSTCSLKEQSALRKLKKAIADKGAQANGTTWYDRTNYYEILPASDDNLKWALDMEADRMVNSLILKEDLAKEFSVVRNEFESGENYPESILQERRYIHNVPLAQLWQVHHRQ